MVTMKDHCGSCRYFTDEDSLGEGFCIMQDICTGCAVRACEEYERNDTDGYMGDDICLNNGNDKI